jgi:type I restriction enzyme S subunit
MTSIKKYKLGDLIQESFRKNNEMLYDISYVRGISNNKTITDTKADVDESVINKFYIVNPGEFVYNPRTTRMGEKVGLGYNNTETPLLFSFNNIAFFIKESAKDIILPEYLYMYFNRTEFDRYAMINGWGSATELFTMSEMYDIDIELPSLSIQQKYVNIYNAILKNQHSCEEKLEDLKMVCDYYIEGLRKKEKSIIGNHIMEYNEKNDNLVAKKEMGVSINKEFFPTKANASDVKKQKIVYPNTFAYNTNTSRNSDSISIALNDSREAYAVSNTYCVFKTDDKLIPEYLLLWLKRKEFDRYARFNSWGSARETIELDDIKMAEIAIPTIEVQKSIVNIHLSYMEYYNLNGIMKEKIKSICPVLIKGSLEEAKREE